LLLNRDGFKKITIKFFQMNFLLLFVVFFVLLRIYKKKIRYRSIIITFEEKKIISRVVVFLKFFVDYLKILESKKRKLNAFILLKTFFFVVFYFK